MNILEAEDIIKGLPDDALMQESEMPTGQLPQFLVVSEIQRRSDMRNRYAQQMQEQPQGTVADQIKQQGIMSMMPQMGMPQMGMPPQMMSAGGIVKLANNGQPAKIQALMDALAVGGVTAADLLAQGYTLDQIQAAQRQLSERMSMPVSGMDGVLPAGQIADAARPPQSGYGDQYDEPFIRGFTNVISDKASELASAASRGIESLGIEAQKQMPNYGLVGRNDLSFPSLPMPERRSQAEMGQMFSQQEVEERLARRPSLVEDLDLTPMEFLNQRVLGREPSASKPGSESAGPTGELLELTQNVHTDASDPRPPLLAAGNEAPAPYADYESVIGVTGAGDENVQGGGREVQGGGREVQGGSKYGAFDDLLAELTGGDGTTDEGLDISDLLADQRRMTQANMLMQLGAGIAGGDVSKGLSAAGMAGMKGAEAEQSLALKERLAKYQAGRQDLKRTGDVKLAIAKMNAELERSDDVTKRSIINYYSDLATELRKKATALAPLGETLNADEQALLAAISEMVSTYSGQFGLGLPKITPSDRDPLNLNIPTPGM